MVRPLFWGQGSCLQESAGAGSAGPDAAYPGMLRAGKNAGTAATTLTSSGTPARRLRRCGADRERPSLHVAVRKRKLDCQHCALFRAAALAASLWHVPCDLQNYDAEKEVVIASTDPFYADLVPK